MVKKTYQEKLDGEKVAKAYSSNKRISVKYATELCREIRGRPVDKVEKYLNRVINQEDFLPLRKYNRKVGHRKGESKSGVKSGRFPKNACTAFLELVGSAKANADFKGLDTENLLVAHAFASMGFRRRSHQSKGRIAGRPHRRKSAHIEVILREGKK